MLCDFGSAAPPSPAPTSVVECRRMDEDVQKHTTLQYRSPEMVDVYRKQPLNEKADIWALGVFLYKLCYYTTPFEDQGQLAILNASYKFPSHPSFSAKIKTLIGMPRLHGCFCPVLTLVASMLREDLNSRPNIYQVVAEACLMQRRRIPIHDVRMPIHAARYVLTSQIYSGRSSSPAKSHHETRKPVVGVSVSAPVQSQEKLPDITPMRRGRPTASPANGPAKRVTAGDPFAALDSGPSNTTRATASDDISDRFPSLNEFSLLHHKGSKFDFDPRSPTGPKPSLAPKANMADKIADAAFAASRQAASNPGLLERPHSATPVMSHRSNEVPAPSSIAAKPPIGQPVNSRPVSIQQLPTSVTPSRYVSTGTMTFDAQRNENSTAVIKSSESAFHKPIGRSASVVVRPTAPAASVSSKPPMRPATPETPTFDNVRGYSEFNATRHRPISTNLDTRQQSLPYHSKVSTSAIRPPSRGESLQLEDHSNTARNAKPSTNNLQATNANAKPIDSSRDGAFGSAFDKFEENATPSEQSKIPAQSRVAVKEPVPGAGVETGAEESDDGDAAGLTPEMRRERERLQLEEEEQRVAAAQSEYRQRLAGAVQGKKPVPGPKPNSIQSRVQAYISDEQSSSEVKRTAEGYGKYADAATAASKTKPPIKRKPVLPGVSRSSTMPQSASTLEKPETASTVGASSLTSLQKPTPRPPPKKPEYLNSIPTGADVGRSLSPVKNRAQEQTEKLVAESFPGQPALDWSSKDKEDYLDDFSKRFPSLSAIEGASTGK